MPEVYARRLIKEFIFDLVSPLVNVLHMVDFNLRLDHHVLDQILEEKGEKLDKTFNEFRLIAMELFKTRSE